MVTAWKITIKTEQSIHYVQVWQYQPTEIPVVSVYTAPYLWMHTLTNSASAKLQRLVKWSSY